jgi:hypothetical protein
MPNALGVDRALLAHADALADELAGNTTQFTPDEEADRLVREDPFVGVPQRLSLRGAGAIGDRFYG